LRPTGPPTGSGSSSAEVAAPKAPGKARRRRASRLFRFDRSLGSRYVAGADEAGRGSLAGPLVAAGILIDHSTLSRRDRTALGLLNDSKQMSLEEREHLFPVVLRASTRVAVEVRCVSGIDSRGLHNTNIAALARCLERVWVDGATCLSDGFRLPGCTVEHRAVVDGDATSAAIAAASVIAKVTRDRFMRRASGRYPEWDFAGNVGYSTPEHRDAIREHGISALHRRSFNSIAYSQLELGGEGDVPADLAAVEEAADELAASEGVADVLEPADPPAAVEEHPDDVEAQHADAA
jgi:ribonuclease HII